MPSPLWEQISALRVSLCGSREVCYRPLLWAREAENKRGGVFVVVDPAWAKLGSQLDLSPDNALANTRKCYRAQRSTGEFCNSWSIVRACETVPIYPTHAYMCLMSSILYQCGIFHKQGSSICFPMKEMKYKIRVRP